MASIWDTMGLAAIRLVVGSEVLFAVGILLTFIARRATGMDWMPLGVLAIGSIALSFFPGLIGLMMGAFSFTSREGKIATVMSLAFFAIDYLLLSKV